jgi:hypothetical protein
LNDEEVQEAAAKIQAAFKGHKARVSTKKIKKMLADLPDLNDQEVQDAAAKIQAAFKGHKVRANTKKSKQIQDDLPDLKDKEVQDAASKIQAAFKGHKVRANTKKSKQIQDDLPDLKDKEVQDAASKIQAAFKGHKVRASNKMKTQKMEDLPDLLNTGVQDATVKIQSAFRGFQTRKGAKQQKKDENDAAVKIQAAFKGGKTREQLRQHQVTVMSVTKAFDNTKGSVKSKKMGVSATPAPSVDFGENMIPRPAEPERKNSLVEGTSNANFFKAKPCPVVLIKTVPVPTAAEFGAQKAHKSPLPERSIKLKEVPIPQVPASQEKSKPGESPDSSAQSAAQSAAQAAFTGLIRQASLGNFFKRANNASTEPTASTPPTTEKSESLETHQDSPPPSSPDVDVTSIPEGSQRKKSIGNILRTNAGEAGRKVFSLPQVAAAATKEAKSSDNAPPHAAANSSGGSAAGFFTSFFKRTEKKLEKPAEVKQQQKPQEPHPISNVAFKFDHGKVPTAKPVQPEPQTEKDEPPPPPPSVKPKEVKNKPPPGRDDDLIQVVLTAVEENWLKQAPQPTLDKKKALRVEQEESADHSESERDTSEADYLKVKAKVTATSDDEGSSLVRQESNGERDLPYLETTLPQETPGTVTITPSSRRVTECKLASVERPRSASPRNPGKLDELKQKVPPGEGGAIKVVLPRQDSKSSMARNQPKQPWETFATQGLQSPRQARKTKQRAAKPGSSAKVYTPQEWVNCDELPSPPKPIRQYDSDDTSSSSSESPPPPPPPIAQRPATAPKPKGPLPKKPSVPQSSATRQTRPPAPTRPTAAAPPRPTTAAPPRPTSTAAPPQRPLIAARPSSAATAPRTVSSAPPRQTQTIPRAPPQASSTSGVVRPPLTAGGRPPKPPVPKRTDSKSTR